ncbi:hypothetical protein PIB30_116009, partial [Stylosanthes scabra]|nr:hypothetical protein [Stylosanthes scabra]
MAALHSLTSLFMELLDSIDKEGVHMMGPIPALCVVDISDDGKMYRADVCGGCWQEETLLDEQSKCSLEGSL